MKRLQLLAALALALALPAVLAASGDLYAQSWSAGFSVHNVRLASPFLYSFNCGSYTTSVRRDAVRGASLHLGRRITSGFEARLQLSDGSQVDPRGCPDASLVRDDGIHTITYYRQEVERIRTRSADLTLAYSPPVVPLQAGATIGWLKGARSPYFAFSVGLRGGPVVRPFADLGLRFGQVRYLEVQEEWQDFELLNSEEVDRGREWVSGRELRLGLEFRFR